MDSPISGCNLLRMTFPISEIARHLRDGIGHLEMAKSSPRWGNPSRDGGSHPEMAWTIPEMGGHLRDGAIPSRGWPIHLRDGKIHIRDAPRDTVRTKATIDTNGTTTYVHKQRTSSKHAHKQQTPYAHKPRLCSGSALACQRAGVEPGASPPPPMSPASRLPWAVASALDAHSVCPATP